MDFMGWKECRLEAASQNDCGLEVVDFRFTSTRKRRVAKTRENCPDPILINGGCRPRVRQAATVERQGTALPCVYVCVCVCTRAHVCGLDDPQSVPPELWYRSLR